MKLSKMPAKKIEIVKSEYQPSKAELEQDMRIDGTFEELTLPIRLTPMTATCRVPPLSRVKLGIGWSRGVARDAEQ